MAITKGSSKFLSDLINVDTSAKSYQYSYQSTYAPVSTYAPTTTDARSISLVLNSPNATSNATSNPFVSPLVTQTSTPTQSTEQEAKLTTDGMSKIILITGALIGGYFLIKTKPSKEKKK